MSSGQHSASTREVMNPIWPGNTLASPGGSWKVLSVRAMFLSIPQITKETFIHTGPDNQRI